MDLIQELEEFGLKNKISQEQLAKKLGVAFSTVNRWFNQKTKPNKIQTYHIRKLLRKKRRVSKNVFS
jgi:transcriptional regulator with XRE-family HTH domain